jgi:hypothetical protein
MTVSEVKDCIKKTIDQYYCQSSKKYIEESQLYFIGGVLQTALHLLMFNDYNEIKQYIYTQYGYDPGGCADGQINIDEILKGE